MTKCRDIIRGAYRRSGLLAFGKDPSSEQFNVGLELLQDFFISRIDRGTFGRLVTIIHEGAADYNAEREYIRVRNVDGANFVLPDSIQDSDGTYRAPIQGAIIINVDVANDEVATYVYNTSRMTWDRIEDLVIGSECPLTPGKDDDLKNILALLLAEEAGLQPTVTLVQRAALSRANMSVNFQSESRNRPTEYF